MAKTRNDDRRALRRRERRQRMAGEKLSPEMNQGDANGRAGEEKTLSQTSLEDRFGADLVDKMRPEGLQDATEKGEFSRKELLAEMRRRGKGVDTDVIKERFQGYIDDGSKFNAKARDYLKKLGLSGFGGGGGGSDEPESPMPELPDPETPDTPPAPPPQPTPPVPAPPAPVPPPSGMPRPPIRYPNGISISQEQNITQDNDINTTINGDGNTVNNNQDNSIVQSASVGNGYLADWMKKYLR